MIQQHRRQVAIRVVGNAVCKRTERQDGEKYGIQEGKTVPGRQKYAWEGM